MVQVCKSLLSVLVPDEEGPGGTLNRVRVAAGLMRQAECDRLCNCQECQSCRFWGCGCECTKRSVSLRGSSWVVVKGGPSLIACPQADLGRVGAKCSTAATAVHRGAQVSPQKPKSKLLERRRASNDAREAVFADWNGRGREKKRRGRAKRCCESWLRKDV